MKMSPLVVERESASNAMESINTAIDAIKHGESVIIFAEGTRSKEAGNYNNSNVVGSILLRAAISRLFRLY